MINQCCEKSMHQVDNGYRPDGFEKTGERAPIGKDMDFYTCIECGDRWCRVQLTAAPYTLTWETMDRA